MTKRGSIEGSRTIAEMLEDAKKPLEPVQFDNMLEGYPLYFIAEDTAVFRDYEGDATMWAHVIFHLEEDDLDVTMLGPEPHPHGAFDFGNLTWSDMLDCSGWSLQQTGMQWMLKNGIAPGQRVWIEMTVKWFQCSCEYDWDCEYNHRIMWREPWTEEQHAEAWERYMEIEHGWCFTKRRGENV